MRLLSGFRARAFAATVAIDRGYTVAPDHPHTVADGPGSAERPPVKVELEALVECVEDVVALLFPARLLGLELQVELQNRRIA